MHILAFLGVVLVVVVHTVVCLWTGYHVCMKRMEIAVSAATEARDLAASLVNEEAVLLSELQRVRLYHRN